MPLVAAIKEASAIRSTAWVVVGMHFITAWAAFVATWVIGMQSRIVE